MRPAILLSLVLCLLPHLATSQRQTAALVIGGYWPALGTQPILNHVELFGCENAATASTLLETFPENNYLGAGVLREEEGRVLACGGYSCTETPNVCNTRADCFWWTAATGMWTRGPTLTVPRFNYMMAEVQNLNTPDDAAKTPLVLGYFREQTEIYDVREDAWTPYRDIVNISTINSLTCAVDYNNKIYTLIDKVMELDPATWAISEIGTIPTPLARSGKCAGITIGGRPGIFTRHGYWYDLQARSWQRKANPPVVPIAGITNAIWSFRGKATIFGHPVCDDMGVCLNTQVVQYDDVSDTWVVLGDMLHPRTYHTVIEVPGEYCDGKVVTVPSTTSTTTVGSTTTTAGVVSVASSSLVTVVAAVVATLMRS